jgi:hypothetical protein
MRLEAFVRAFLIRERVKLDRLITVAWKLTSKSLYKFVYREDSRRLEARMDEAGETVNWLPMAQPVQRSCHQLIISCQKGNTDHG